MEELSAVRADASTISDCKKWLYSFNFTASRAASAKEILKEFILFYL